MDSNIIRIGTRGSKLALWQAEMVKEKLDAVGYKTEIIKISTKGDKILNKSIAKIGSKGVFTEEIEAQLRSGDIDIAVHSAKDLQSELDEGLEIIAFTEREEAYDVVISYNSDFSLSQEHDLIVGTSSTRRVAMLKHHHPQMRIASIRGNLQTRMKRLEEGICDALLLAYAGVHRMGYDEYIVEKLPIDTFTPPAGQGSVAIEICNDTIQPGIKDVVYKTLNHKSTQAAIIAERSFLKELNGGCSVPVFVHATFIDNVLNINGGVCELDGSTILREKKSVKVSLEELLDGKSLEIGKSLAQEIIKQGGKEILKKIKEQEIQ